MSKNSEKEFSTVVTVSFIVSTKAKNLEEATKNIDRAMFGTITRGKSDNNGLIDRAETDDEFGVMSVMYESQTDRPEIIGYKDFVTKLVETKYSMPLLPSATGR